MILYVESFAVPRFGPVIIGVTEKGLRYVTFGPKAAVATLTNSRLKVKWKLPKMLTLRM